MPIEVTCRSCGKILILKDTMAGKSGKCPKCGNIIRVPRPVSAEQQPQNLAPGLTAHAQGVKVRGGVKKEEVPLPGSMMVGFTRSTALVKARTAGQATVGLGLAAVGLVLAFLPTIPTQLNTPPVLGIGGGMIGALGAAVAGWGLLNIIQQPRRFKGKGLAAAGVAAGVLAFVVGLVVFSGGGGSAGARGSLRSKTAALAGIVGKAARGDCAEQLKGAYKILKTYAEQHRGRFPSDLTSLLPKYIDDMKPFCCPVAGDGTILYEYNPGLTTESPPEAPLLYDRKGNHEGGRNVLLVGGKVVWMTEEEFQQALEAVKGPAAPPAEAATKTEAPAEGGGR